MTSSPISNLLSQIRPGNESALGQLLSAIYGELRLIAAHELRAEREAYSLGPTELVHETYLRMFAKAPRRWPNRAYFFASVARSMRRILVERARARSAVKRQGQKVPLKDGHLTAMDNPDTWIELDQALTILKMTNPRLARVVELRLLGGPSFR